LNTLSAEELKEVNGGVVQAFLAGAAAGALAKKLYDKYAK
jgi:lactobin A/cerein 7B family class IIb bacteriocin